MDMPLYELTLTLIVCRKNYNPTAFLLLADHRQDNFLTRFVQGEARFIQEENGRLMQRR
jgi:hypothetical protein